MLFALAHYQPADEPGNVPVSKQQEKQYAARHKQCVARLEEVDVRAVEILVISFSRIKGIIDAPYNIP